MNQSRCLDSYFYILKFSSEQKGHTSSQRNKTKGSLKTFVLLKFSMMEKYLKPSHLPEEGQRRWMAGGQTLRALEHVSFTLRGEADSRPHAPPESPRPRQRCWRVGLCRLFRAGRRQQGPTQRPETLSLEGMPGVLLVLCFRAGLQKCFSLSKQPVAIWLPTATLPIYQEKCSFKTMRKVEKISDQRLF